MRFIRQLREALTDRRPRIRRSRSRRRNPWRLIGLLIAVIAIIWAIVSWTQSAMRPQGHSVEVSTDGSGDGSGIHRLNGKRVTIGELEAALIALRGTGKPLFIAITGPRKANGSIWPSPDVEALLTRLDQSWMAVPLDQGGEHGR